MKNISISLLPESRDRPSENIINLIDLDKKTVNEILGVLRIAIGQILNPDNLHKGLPIPSVSVWIVQGASGELIFTVTSSNIPEDESKIRLSSTTNKEKFPMINETTLEGEPVRTTFIISREQLKDK